MGFTKWTGRGNMTASYPAKCAKNHGTVFALNAMQAQLMLMEIVFLIIIHVSLTTTILAPLPG